MIIITSVEDRAAKCDGCGAQPEVGKFHHTIMATERYHDPAGARRFLGTFCSICAVWTGRELANRAIDAHVGRVSNEWEGR